MSISSKIQSLITAANTVTGESRTDLTSAVQDLKDGYGGSTVTKGLVFSDYDSNGYPTKAEFVGSWTSIPNYYLRRIFTMYSVTPIFAGKIKSITIPNTVTTLNVYCFSDCSAFQSITIPSSVTTIKNNCFEGCGSVKTVLYEGNVPNIENSVFKSCSLVTLYDFSNHTGTVPSLYNTASLGHASDCVIKVPQSLLSTWQNSTNWIDLQNVTWQGV